MTTERRCTTAEFHCEQCGREVWLSDCEDGYTPCCNEIATLAADCRGHHLRNSR